jgi:hypothetical protein
MFRLEAFPACEGDCLMLSWGEGTDLRRILIDGGRAATASHVLAYANKCGLKEGAFELFIITHIDRDHIEGAVELLREGAFRALVKEVWFNDRGDLDYAPPRPGFETFGALDGERLTTLIRDHEMRANRAFSPAPVAVLDGSLPVVPLPEGLTVTVLSPDLQQLADLAQPWDDTLEKAPAGWEEFGEPGPIDVALLAQSKFKSDSAKPNGACIALAAEYRGRHILLAGDAHVQRLLESLRIYRQMYPDFSGFSLVKASHHGSRGNTSLELVQALHCNHWLVSTNGSQFKHPDPEAIARIIVGSSGKVVVFFNYETKFTSCWRGALARDYALEPRYGREGYVAVEVPSACS